MLETLVSSKIRRALLEHLLTHPDERCYLRGLAKALNLSISPLRRELLRLERLGMLAAYDEANIRFYVVNQASPSFLQLKQVASGQSASLPTGLTLPVEDETTSEPEPKGAVAVSPEPSPEVEAIATASVPVSVAAASGRRSLWTGLAAGVSLMASLALIFGGIVHLAVPKQKVRRVVLTPVAVMPAETTFSAPSPASQSVTIGADRPSEAVGQASATGEMRSSRWRLQPGAIGGGWSQ